MGFSFHFSSFHAVLVFGLGKNLLSKSILGRCAVRIDQVYSNVKIHPHTKPRHRRFRLERRRRMQRYDWSTNRSVNRRCRRFETPVYTQIFLGRDSKKLSVIF